MTDGAFLLFLITLLLNVIEFIGCFLFIYMFSDEWKASPLPVCSG